jgi:hypothetical protein
VRRRQLPPTVLRYASQSFGLEPADRDRGQLPHPSRSNAARKRPDGVEDDIGYRGRSIPHEELKTLHRAGQTEGKH